MVWLELQKIFIYIEGGESLKIFLTTIGLSIIIFLTSVALKKSIIFSIILSINFFIVYFILMLLFKKYKRDILKIFIKDGY